MNNREFEELQNKIIPIPAEGRLLYRGVVRKIVSENVNTTLPWYKQLVNKLYTDFIDANYVSKSRQPTATYVFERGSKIREPELNYTEILQLSQVHWLLRTIFRAIIGEVINPGYGVAPRFKKRCVKCGKEFKITEVDECDICGGRRFDKPAINQYTDFSNLIKSPSKNRTFKEFLRSTLWYGLALDNFYWEIGHRLEYNTETKNVERVPAGIRVLQSDITKPVMDEYGGFGSTEYFCPVCYKKQFHQYGQDTYIDIKTLPLDQQGTIPRCKDCGGELMKTAYVQAVGDKIIARFGEDEIVQGTIERIDPQHFGQSKIQAALKHILIIDFMDEYNYQVFGKGHVSKLLLFPGSDENQIEIIKTSIQNELNSLDRMDVRTGEMRTALGPMLILQGVESGKEPRDVDLMPDLNALQSIDFYRLYIDKVAGLFGATPIFTGATTPDDGGNFGRTRIDVQNRTTKGYMKDILEPFNEILLPRLGITDWILEFGKIESRDELRDTMIKQRIAATVSLYESTGFDTEVSEDGSTFTVSPKRVREPEARSRLQGMRTSQTAADSTGDRTDGVGVEPSVPIEEPELNIDEE
uniref:Putative portal protein n=1 Tax=viral metagenome TaxID=1070528 RepID=A0A6M3XTN2_9ZZZZ